MQAISDSSPALSSLSPDWRNAVQVALDEECKRRHHLVIYLSGSHAYGFPSPDSDVDLKAIHIEPTRRLLGLRTPALHADRLEVIAGVEIDYTSNEIAPALAGVLAGNGNYIERVLGALVVSADPALDALRPLVAASLSRRVFRHYAGFATSQRKAVDAAETPAAKKVLYVLRTALTGAHLLRTGELIADVRELADDYGFADARQLIEVKRSGERVTLSGADATRWRGALDRAIAALEAAVDASPLPAEPPDPAPLEDWLLALRRRFWDGPPVDADTPGIGAGGGS
jgi:hypothetical protein